MSTYTNKQFWTDALERGVRAFGSSSLGVLGANVGGLASIDVSAWLSISGMAVLMSFMFSLAGTKFGDDSASFVSK